MTLIKATRLGHVCALMRRRLSKRLRRNSKLRRICRIGLLRRGMTFSLAEALHAAKRTCHEPRESDFHVPSLRQSHPMEEFIRCDNLSWAELVSGLGGCDGAQSLLAARCPDCSRLLSCAKSVGMLTCTSLPRRISRPRCRPSGVIPGSGSERGAHERPRRGSAQAHCG